MPEPRPSLDKLFDSVFVQVGRYFPLTQVELDPEIAKPKSMLKLLDATHYNWNAKKFRKIFGMRFKVRVPPLEDLLGKYPPFEFQDRYPDWMQKYRQPCSIYGMFPRERFDDLQHFAHDFLEGYLLRAKEAKPVVISERLVRIADFHTQFV